MKKITKLFMMLALMAAVTISARADEPEMGLKWEWQGTNGGSWDDMNWGFGGNSGLAFNNISTALSPTFSGSFWQESGTWYFQTNEAVKVGQMLYSGSNPSDSFFFGRTTITGTTDTPGVYTLNRANGGANGQFITDLRTRGGVNPTFENVNGTVTVDGIKYMNSLLINGNNNNLIFTSANAATTSGTFWLNNDRGDREGKIHMNGGGYVELNNLYITNLNLDDPTNRTRLNIRNEGSGTLAFNNVTIMGGDSVRLSSSAVGRVMTFRDVTFAALDSREMQIGQGTYYFYGDNVKTNLGTLQIGEGGSAHVYIVADGMLKLEANSAINLGRGSNSVIMNVQGLLAANQSDSTTGGENNIRLGDQAGSLGYLSLTGTGQTYSHRMIVGQGGVGTLVIEDTGAVIANDEFIVANNSNSSGDVWVGDSGTLWAGRGVNIGNASNTLGTLDIYGNGRVELNASANNDTTGVGNSGTGIVNISGNGYMSTRNLIIGRAATGDGKVMVSDNATLLTRDLYVGTNGAKAELTIGGGYVDVGAIDTAQTRFLYINQANNVDGSSGIVTVSGGTLSTSGIIFGSNNATVGTGTAILNLTGGKLILREYRGIRTGVWDSPSGNSDYNQTASDTQINLGGGAIESWDNWSSGLNMKLTGIGGDVSFINSGTGGTPYNVTLRGVLSGEGGLRVEKGTLILDGVGGTPTVHTYTGKTVIDDGAEFRLTNLAEMTVSLLALENNNWSAFGGEGTLTLNGKLNLTGFESVGGESWRLFDETLLTGLTIGDKSTFLKDFTWDGSDTWTYDQNDLFIFNLSTGLLVIPEPSTWALLGVGVALLAFMRRKRS